MNRSDRRKLGARHPLAAVMLPIPVPRPGEIVVTVRARVSVMGEEAALRFFNDIDALDASHPNVDAFLHVPGEDKPRRTIAAAKRLEAVHEQQQREAVEQAP